MFEELIPLLAQRTVLLTLSRVSDHKIRVNVIPKPVKSDLRDDNTALTTPLAVTGTPKELDEQLSSTLKSAREQMDAAAKAAREAARKSVNAKSHSGCSSATPSPARVQIEIGIWCRSP